MAMRSMDKLASSIMISNAEHVNRSLTCAPVIIRIMPAPIRTSNANRIPVRIMWAKRNVKFQTDATGAELT